LSDAPDAPPSIGRLYESIDRIRVDSLLVARGTTESYEKELATQVHDLADVVADVLYLLREHLSCHDCKVVDHTHYGSVRGSSVEQVFEGVVERVDE
jgi:hypothetical protein